jgi:hypothetical protein
VVQFYSEEQITALKSALLLASFFVLVGAWFARSLPDRPLSADEDADPDGVGCAPPHEIPAHRLAAPS